MRGSRNSGQQSCSTADTVRTTTKCPPHHLALPSVSFLCSRSLSSRLLSSRAHVRTFGPCGCVHSSVSPLWLLLPLLPICRALHSFRLLSRSASPLSRSPPFHSVVPPCPSPPSSSAPPVPFLSPTPRPTVLALRPDSRTAQHSTPPPPPPLPFHRPLDIAAPSHTHLDIDPIVPCDDQRLERMSVAGVGEELHLRGRYTSVRVRRQVRRTFCLPLRCTW